MGCWVKEDLVVGSPQSGWSPFYYDWDEEDVLVPLKVHQYSEGYWWIRLPYSGGKCLFHRQWWQDHQVQRKLGAHEEVHHKNGLKGDNKSTNLEMITGRAHRRHHGHLRRAPPILGRRFRVRRSA